jgi:hypothetical protein
MPSTLGIDVVGMSGQDVRAAITLAVHPRNLILHDDLTINDDPFVCISVHEKTAVICFLIHNQQTVVQTLRVMSG